MITSMALRGKSIVPTPFEVYTKYLALKNHFESKSYDYHKYGGKVKATQTSFDVRKDKHFFYRLSKMKPAQCEEYMLANIVDGSGKFYAAGSGQKELGIYRSWKKRQESLLYTFKQDLTEFKDTFDDNLIVPKNEHPYALRLYLRKDICIETLTLIDRCTKVFKYWDKQLADDPIWPDVKFKCEKYSPFLRVDLDKYKGYIMETFSDESSG